jgi:enoyl-[acyl-carrier-protein] reductase (NADH)
MTTKRNIMYYIIDNTNQAVHREPSKRSYAGTQYKTAGAAKAGITRTVKHYQKAFDQVAECVANGESEYMANMYNDYRDATEAHFGRVHKQFASSYTVVAVADYVEPMITKTGICPGTGEQITVTEGINTPHYMSTLSESYWSA